MASSELHAKSRLSELDNDWGRHPAIAFEEAAAVLDLEPWIVQRLRHPAEEITSYLQIPRDAGDTVCIPFFQVLHSGATGQSMGGLSLAADLQLGDCVAAAMDRTWQAALVGFPFGGAAYGLVCDPAELSEKELVSLMRPLARQLKRRCGTKSFLHPGRGCCRQFLGQLFAELHFSHNVVVSGKPDGMTGMDSDQFTAEGVAAIASTALRNAGKPFLGARVAIQGFGALAQAIGRRLLREGMKIVAVSDNSGSVYRADGLILEDLCTSFEHERVLFGYPEAERLTRAELMHVPCEVLILAPGEGELRESNSHALPAKVVIEAEWNAITEQARGQLTSNGTDCVPWFLASTGALIAGYFEGHGIQILTPHDELLAKCYGIVGHAFEQVSKYAVAAECSCDEAAYRLAVEKTADYLRNGGMEH